MKQKKEKDGKNIKVSNCLLFFLPWKKNNEPKIDNNENFCMYPPAIASLKKRPENCPVGNLYPNKL